MEIKEFVSDPDFTAELAPLVQEIEDYVAKPIGTFTKTITTRDSMFGDSPFVALIHSIQLELTDADVSFVAPLSFDAQIKEGELFVRDMFQLYKYKNLLYTMKLSGKEIDDLLEYSYANWFNIMSGYEDHIINFKKDKEGEMIWNERYSSYDPVTRYYSYDSAAGIYYTVDLSKPAGSKMEISGFPDGRPFDPEAEYLAAIGLILARKVKGSEDFLVAGRKLPIWLVTATLFATWWGGGTVLGGSGAAFHDGFHGVIYDPYGAGLTLILAGFFFMKIVHDAKVNTLAQFFSCRYGKWAANWSGLLMVPTYCLWAAVQLVAIGKIFQFILGWPYAVTILLGTAVILFYTVLGGMLAVAWTDFFQVIILLLGLIIIFPLSVKLAGGWGEVVANTPDHFFKIFPAAGSEMAPPTLGGWLWWLGALLGVGLGTLAAPDLYQRAIVAKTGKIANQSALISGAGYWILGAIPVYLAFVAITLISQGTISGEIINEDSEKLILVLIRQVLPPALGGIFIASLLAAVMSSGDSAIFAPAAVLSNDIYKPLYEKSKGTALSDKGLLGATRVSVLVVAATALIIGFFYDNMYDLLIIAFQMLFHVLFFPLVLGVYWKKATAPGAVAGMAVGLVTSLGWVLIAGSMFTEPEWLWALGPGTLGGIVMVITSLVTQKSHPPKPLVTTEGKVLKWPELAGTK